MNTVGQVLEDVVFVRSEGPSMGHWGIYKCAVSSCYKFDWRLRCTSRGLGELQVAGSGRNCETKHS